MMITKKLVAGASILALSAVIAGVGVASAESSSNAAEQGAKPSYAELQEEHPNEFESAMTHKSDEEGEDNSHAGFQALMETPAQRDVSGAIIKTVSGTDAPDFTAVQLKCVTCKSSLAVDMYQEYGADVLSGEMILDEESMAYIDGRYFDCYSCHEFADDGTMSISANCAYANEDVFPLLGASMHELFDETELLCGQCHNSVSARSSVYDEETIANYDPYRYGYDFDALYDCMVEDGRVTTDEATGMTVVSMNHPQLEMFQDSIHQSMGLSCVDCHMTTSTDENGNEYTSHNASGSVAQNDAAMEKCLTCHSKQSGLETIDDMRAFLADNQAEQLEHQTATQEQLDALYDLILAGCEDESLYDANAFEEAKANWSRANWYVKEQQQNLCDPADGAQIAHNPTLMRSLLDQADALVADGIDLLTK